MDVKKLALILLFSASAQAKDFITITAVGDIMMGTNYPSATAALPANDGVGLFKPAESWIKASDIRFGNFEGTLFDGLPQPDGKVPGPNRYLFRTPTRMAERLSEAGFNVMSLANNHIKDFGSAGTVSTKNALTNVGIKYSSKAVGDSAHFTIDGTTVAIIATDYYRGARSITQPESTYAEIRNLKSKGFLVVVSSHAGAEGAGAQIIPRGPELFHGENRGDSISFARTAIDKGADVIIMHGPHVPRGMEIYKNRLIIYSLGNFLTGVGINIAGMAGLAPLVRFQITNSGEFRGGQIVSFIQKNSPHRIELDRQHSAMRLIKDVSQQQFPESHPQFENDGTFK